MKKLSEKDKILHMQFSRYGRNAREWMRKCVLLLPEIERNHVWEKKGFRDIYEYAAKLAGMTHEMVNESLRVLHKIEDKPLLQKIVEQKGINIIRPIVSMVNKENEKFWADKASTMSKPTLEAYARAIREESQRPGSSEIFTEKVEIKMEIPRDLAEKLQKLKGQNGWEDLMKEFLKLREEKLAAELKEIKTKAKSRPTPTKIKKYVLHKTNHTCAFPGCNKPAENLHHTDRFAITKNHDPEKIIPLCKEHHELAHEGLIENEDMLPEFWKILQKADPDKQKSTIDQLFRTHRQKSLSW